MGFWEDLRKNAGNAVDGIGTAAGNVGRGLPGALGKVDFGISELIAGGKTANSGRVAYVPGVYQGQQFASPASIAPIDQAAGGGGGDNGAGGGAGAGAIATGTSNGYYYDPQAVAAAQKAAQDNARKAQLKGEGRANLDQLYALYDELTREIQRIGGEQSNRINKDFDGKVQQQTTDMNNGMYETDASAAANNLADSSWRSFDRGKVRTAAETNIKTLNSAREGALSEVGQMVAGDTAKYKADQDGIARTRSMLDQSDDLTEIQNTANTLDTTKRSVQADKAKYATDGEFAKKANSVGKYDTSTLEQTLQSVIQNASATPATKSAAMKDILDGTPLDDAEKERLKNKYTQNI